MDTLYTQELQSVDGFDITFNALAEDVPLSDTLDCTDQELKEYYKKLENYDLVYFCAEVTASRCGVNLAHNYLGCCIYVSYDDFIQANDYIQDMIQMAVEDAKHTLKQMNQGE